MARTTTRVIEKEWEEGRKFMEEYTVSRFRGDAVWGAAPSTWIKYCVSEDREK